MFLQGFELVDAVLGVARPDLLQGLVLVPALSHVLDVQLVVCGGLHLRVSQVSQLILQSLQVFDVVIDLESNFQSFI